MNKEYTKNYSLSKEEMNGMTKRFSYATTTDKGSKIFESSTTDDVYTHDDKELDDKTNDEQRKTNDACQSCCEPSIICLSTDEQFKCAFRKCRKVFYDKLLDYGASWRIMRPQSVTDQIYIKANRIRSIEESNGVTMVNEGVLPEFIGIVNYGIIGLIQLVRGYSKDGTDMSTKEVLDLYEKYATISFELMQKKNHDYDEAWRMMRICSYTDLILMKICRTKSIESNNGKTKVSEGIDANYLDMINYAIFGIIKLLEEEESVNDKKK